MEINRNSGSEGGELGGLDFLGDKVRLSKSDLGRGQLAAAGPTLRDSIVSEIPDVIT